MRIWATVKKCKHALIALLLIVSFIATPISNTLQVNRAEAGGVVFDPKNFVQNLATALVSKLVAAATDSLVFKEMILDPLVWILINRLIEKMTADTVKWINSGFQGDPAFVRDFGGFMTQVADETVGDFLMGTDLAFLCSPFNLDIKIALDIQYAASRNFKETAACTLSGVEENIDRFLEGDFIAGGWQGWFEINANPVNNRLGALVVAQEELSVRIGNAKFSEKSSLDWGDGLFSFKQCDEVADESGGHSNCSIVTPGTVIENQLNKALDLPAGRLTIADEFSEVLSALFSQLMDTIFRSGSGLYGSTRPGSGSDDYNSIFDDVLDGSQTGADDAMAQVEKAIAIEESVIALSTSIMQPFLDALKYKDETYGATNLCHPGIFPPGSELDQAYQDAVTNAGDKIQIAQSNLVFLNDLLARMSAAQTEEELSDLFTEYLDFLSTGSLHTQSDITMLEVLIRTSLTNALSLIEDFKATVDNACTLNNI